MFSTISRSIRQAAAALLVCPLIVMAAGGCVNRARGHMLGSDAETAALHAEAQCADKPEAMAAAAEARAAATAARRAANATVDAWATHERRLDLAQTQAAGMMAQAQADAQRAIQAAESESQREIAAARATYDAAKERRRMAERAEIGAMIASGGTEGAMVSLSETVREQLRAQENQAKKEFRDFVRASQAKVAQARGQGQANIARAQERAKAHVAAADASARAEAKAAEAAEDAASDRARDAAAKVYQLCPRGKPDAVAGTHSRGQDVHGGSRGQHPDPTHRPSPRPGATDHPSGRR